ncbi:MAG TPA: DEAD/DEAH box helicase family protein [Pseudonocardiaceae bacterium]|nr:DEAD/DEAH box helicase family protein [Pseudonocardiaceae bacterium]
MVRDNGPRRAAPDFAERRFAGTPRRYQQLALDAFERGRDAGETRFYLVLPPGAGKTMVGLEAARRLGRRTLVLTPNTAVQGQWADTWDADFGAGGPQVPCGTDRRLDAPLTALTYQSIAVIDKAGDASQRRAVLREGDREALLGLLHPNGRAVIELAGTLGPWTLVLDECHHLLATWGALLRAVVDTLGPDTALIGLTATPPRQLTGWQRGLRDDLFGPTDFEVPTPALVKEGELAPYQELVYLTRPTIEEDTWLAGQATRFEELQIQLVDKQLGSIPFVEWLYRRVVDRTTERGGQAGWGAFEQAEPALALAALRFAHAGLIPVPEGARFREQHRSAPGADDWVTVLSDFCRGHLQASDDPRDATALAAIKQALPSLGYRLTQQGVRASVSPVDRLCGLSEAKIAAVTHILATEDAALGPALRGLVLCDFEQLSGRLPAGLADAPISQDTGSARLVFSTLAAADVGGVGALRPLLVTGRTFACPTGMAEELAEFCRSAGQSVTLEPLDGARRIVGAADTTARTWVRLATEFYLAGRARVLVGTRALLGEGWDCPAVNVTVDLTTATTSTAITQMRGRSLRLDPAAPTKVADNWTVCCATDDHPRGDADYQRLVRKHEAYFAITADGQIESGVTHCDPALSPFAAPTVEQAQAITATALSRAAIRDVVRTSWQIGSPYAGTELATVRVRSARSLGRSARVLPESSLRPVVPGQHRSRRRELSSALGGGGVVVASAVTALAAGPPIGIGAGVALLVLGAGALTVDAGRRAGELAGAPTAVEQLAAAVADGLHSAGGVDRGAGSVRISSTSDGWLRCDLHDVSVEQSQLFAASLDEVMAPLAEPRHLVGRRVVSVPVGRVGRTVLAGRSLLGLPVAGAVVWHAVPRWCASNPRRLRCFLAAWEQWVGPAREVAADSAEGYAVLELYRGADPFAVTTQMRTVWY